MQEDSRLIRGIKERKKRILTVLKIALVIYLMIFSIKYATSSTAAHFTSSKSTNVTLTAWSDKSELAFMDQGNINLKACPAKTEVTIKNISDKDMESPSKFEVYYIDKDNDPGKDKGGNPIKQGKKIDIPEEQAIIPALASGEQTKLSFVTNKDTEQGFYTFYAYQTNKSVEDVWSVKVKVKCKSNNGQSNNEQKEAPKEEPPKEEVVETEKVENPETITSEETDEGSNQTPENNEQTSTNESEKNPVTTEDNGANQSENAVNNSVPDEAANVEENSKEKDGNE
ncbi:hypothetical protein [Bacillus sinesaloumensis]|uniref:hypothetical protein n=1 Tax=Litchfieldia sinesaloumensis TaxID=1926280 RepID=UPI0009888816|nr:hypothetical protein [Bacillus sinesaloumensis]